MKVSRKWIGLSVLACAIVVSQAGAEQKIDDDLVWKIGQIVIDTAMGEPVEGGPSQKQVDRFRAMGQNSIGPSWGIKKRIEKSAVDGKPITLIYNVTILPKDYKLTDKQKANWEKYALPKPDAHSGGAIAFRAVQEGDVRRHRTIYKLEQDGYRLFMMVGREGDETAEQAVKKTIKGWRKFYDNAVRLELFKPQEKVTVRLAYAPGADHKGELADGQVVHVSQANKGKKKLKFKVHAESPSFKEDEPYMLAVQVKTPKGHAPMKVTDGYGRALAKLKGGYYLLNVKAPGEAHAADLHVEIDPALARKANNGSYAAGPVAVIKAAIIKKDEDGNVTIAPEGAASFGVQGTDWFPIVTKFQIYHLSKKVEGEGKSAVLSAQFASYRFTYSTLAGAVEELDETFRNKIYPMAKIDGQIGEKDPVVLGWQLLPSKPDFVLLQLDQVSEEFKTTVVALPQGSKPFVELWMDVISPAARGEDVNDATDPLADDPLSDAAMAGDGGKDKQVDMTRHQEEFERQIHLNTVSKEYNGLWLNRIAYISPDKRWGSKKEMVADIRRMIRLPVGGQAAKNPNNPNEPISQRVQFMQVKTGFNRYGDLKQSILADDPVQLRDLAKDPGVYELRFKAWPYNINEGGPDVAKEKRIDVAIRFVVIPTKFNARLIDWRTERKN